MSYRLVITSAAQQDIKQTTLHYLDISPILAQRFLDILEDSFNKVEKNPHHYSFFGNSGIIRSMALLKFPCSLLFRIEGEEILIVGLFGAQDPGKLFKRM